MDELPDWSLAKRVGLDTETRDEGLKALGPGWRRGAYIAGISFCIEDDKPYYLPIRHMGGGNLDESQVLAYLRDQSKKFKGSVVGANLNYDMDGLLNEDISFSHNDWRDIQVADPLINELHLRYSMQAISERWGMAGKDEDLLRAAAEDYDIDAKSDMWKLHSKYVGPYAEQDSLLPLQLLRKQERKIEEHGLEAIFALERSLQPVLLKMRRRGVRIDLDKLGEIERWAVKEETEALARVRAKTGIRIAVGDVWKPGALAPALQAEGIVLTKTSQGKDSITKEILAQCGEVGEWIGRARKVNKIRTTFAKSMREHLINGRVHCTFNQMRREKEGDSEDEEESGARYGRLSCSDPNLQQQPSPERDPDIAGEWRKIFIPDEGGHWLCADYSQQEPRWLTHYAEATRCEGAFEAAERYRRDPSTDNHDMMTRVIFSDKQVDEWIATDKKIYKSNRSDCKQIYLGLCYGMGGAKLARKLGLPTRWNKNERTGFSWEGAGEVAQEKLDRFNSGAPYVLQLAKKCENQARSTGIIKTILGRHCHFPEKEGGGYDWLHKALNRLIQGTSADQTKRAVVELDQAGLTPLLQVHDEVDNEVRERREAVQIGEIMRDCVPCTVPHKIDLEIGPSWGEMMSLSKYERLAA